MIEGRKCIDSECPSAHWCPQGSVCMMYMQGTCKFKASGMHGSHTADVRVKPSSSRVARVSSHRQSRLF
ncbi:hypothetical protein BDV93DRAFT_520153, partial [Ceratobasidium sp. AG-I]